MRFVSPGVLLFVIACKGAPPSSTTSTPTTSTATSSAALSTTASSSAGAFTQPPNTAATPASSSRAPDGSMTLTDPKLFVRDQPPSTGLVPWNGGAVTRTSPLRFVDVTAGKASTLSLPGAKLVLDVATRGADALALVAMNDGKLVIARNDAGAWSVLDAVPTKYDDKIGYRLAADDKLVVWEPTRIHTKVAAAWRTVPVTKLEGAPRGFPKTSLLSAGTLYLGYAAGEWGGALVAIDVASGQAKIEPAGDATNEPVTGLARDGQGVVWVTRGQSHLGSAFGVLLRRGATQFETVALSPGKLHKSARLVWPLEDSAFEGLAFDGTGRLHVLSGSLGIVKQLDSGSFRRVTPEWPSWVYVTGLVFRGDLAVIGTYDAGVVIFDPKTNRATRVTL